jgi:tetratricopeptide (TPR) repeat protein
VWLLPTLPAHAGVYNTEEPLLNVLLDAPAQYPALLRYLQTIVAEELTHDEKSSRYSVLRRVETLERQLKEGQLTEQERINLSAFYIRLNKPEKAVALLEPVPHKQRDWMLLSNLATAYQLLGSLDRAEAYLMEALENWPQATPVTNSWRLNWLKVVEQHQLRLIRGRLREQRMPSGTPVGIDSIFTGLRLVGPSGEYEAGLLANDQWAKVPANYMEIVKLLVLWMPHDARLRWFLAEMFNANGNLVPALEMMDELSETRNFRNGEFAVHQLTLRRAKTIAERLIKLRPEFVAEHVANPLPLAGGLLPAGPSAVLNAGNSMLALQKIVQAPLPKEDTLAADNIATSPATNDQAKINWTPEWRQISVSFVAGVIVALLLSMQLREMRKRKQETAPATREQAP